MVPGIPWYKPTSENASNELLKTILEKVVLPEGTLVIILDSNQAKLRRLLAATEQSIIYSR